ncbi:MAG: hypothetical protein KC636_01910 [Myxococcales bacterium]|nr:hypothetical protein [Myxococcales bacterium]
MTTSMSRALRTSAHVHEGAAPAITSTSAVGRRLDQCSDEAASGDDERGCMPSVAIVGDAPLVCDPILPGGIPEGLSLGDHERQRAFLFALPREVEAPEVVGMSIAV